MNTMTTHYLTCTDPHGTHRIAYQQWGDPDNPRVLVCVHGLTRNSRDFDSLAAALATNYRVLCPDVVGRGDSDYLSNPEDYGYPLYVADALALLEHLQITTVDWIGTSMGGAIGMCLAATLDSPIQRMILNDVGAFVPKTALAYIAAYLIQPQREFATLEEVERHSRLIYAPFGNLPNEHWRYLALHSVRPLPTGGYRLAYDPEIALPFRGNAEIDSIELWDIWQGVNCPVLLLHGEQSQLLLPETITQMQAIHPTMQVVTIPNVGHAPTLMNEEQIQLIKDWLL